MTKEADRALRSKDDVRAAKAHPDGRKRQFKVDKVSGLSLVVSASGFASYIHEYRITEGNLRLKRKTSGPDPSADPSGNPTSAKLIAASVAAGTITQEQGLIYGGVRRFWRSAIARTIQGR